MNIKMTLYYPEEMRAYAVFLNTVAEAIEKRRAENGDDKLGGIDNAVSPMWQNRAGADANPEGRQTEPLVLDEKAFLGEQNARGNSATQAAAARKRGEPSPGHKRRTKAEIAEDEAADRHPEAETAAISTGGERVAPDDEPEVVEQDAADEAAETAKAGAELSHDDVRGAMGKYVEKFGMDAAQIDLPKLFALALKDPAITKVSLIPGDQKSLKIVVDGVNEMLTKNPFSRDAVA